MKNAFVIVTFWLASYSSFGHPLILRSLVFSYVSEIGNEKLINSYQLDLVSECVFYCTYHVYYSIGANCKYSDNFKSIGMSYTAVPRFFNGFGSGWNSNYEPLLSIKSSVIIDKVDKSISLSSDFGVGAIAFYEIKNVHVYVKLLYNYQLPAKSYLRMNQHFISFSVGSNFGFVLDHRHGFRHRFLFRH